MFDFPNSPTAGQQVTGAGNQVYTFDGQKWGASGAGLNQATANARYVNVSGDTMAGDLLLAADPTASMQAANKHYVNNAINLAGNYLGTWQVAANSPSISAGGSIANANYVAVTANPVVAETAPVGIPGIAGQSINNGDRIIWASGLSVWQILRGASDTSRVAKAGDTMTGSLTFQNNLQGIVFSDGASIYRNTGASLTLREGTGNTQPMICDNDGSNIRAVLDYVNGVPKAGGTMSGLLVLSADPAAALGAATKQYADTKYAASNPSGYQTAAQVATTVSAAVAAQTNVGRNLIHNAGFTVAQRGVGPWTTSVYTVDRWSIAFASDAFSFSQSVIGDASRAQIGDEAAQWQLANTFTGNPAAGAYHYITQKVENVRRLAGKTVTVSFYGLAGAAIKLGVSFYQGFGTGGSPSALVTVPGQSITFAGGWARYSLTFTLPSVDGKILGTNNDSSTWLNFWYSCGATNAALAGNIGVQSGTIQLWGVQLEIGSVATPLEKRDPVLELQQCQRFYFAGQAVLAGYQAAGAGIYAPSPMPVTMRANPVVATVSAAGNANVGAVTWIVVPGQVVASASATALGAFVINTTFTASSDL